MSGYTRRPGAPPLSRTRSLVVPDAPAFYERRSCLPQLDCERPHGGDLHPHFFGFRPTFMCYVPSPVLASVGDTDFGYGKGKYTKQGPPGAHETRFGGDKLEDLEEANPFSFKEFLKTKNLSLSKEDTSNSRIYPKETSRHPLGVDHSSPAPQPVGYGLEYQQPFFEDPTRPSNLEEEEEEDGWNGAYLPSTVDQTHSSRATENLSPCGTYLSFFSNASELAGPQSLPPWTMSDPDSRVSPASPAGSPNTDFAAHGESLGDRHLRTLQISYEAKRAVKAENHVMKLKQDISLLQTQLSSFKRENEALRSGQGASLAVVKQNTDVALQNLHVVMNSAHASIKQLVSGAETLNLVAEILKSIDRITEIKDEADS
ncbi:endosome-associated-trafficking regulator 1 isoform X3 [Cricetulus griseus]|uniref:Endosome-associated-trafficking regulator 1 n=1 Tax=Cricetulus griseus TaxID=10029 RepID=A0A9J7H098_CRIGR|nr:endosome-associated-trafficking regulator 1 isoform X7 [Cricetulus griseus]XP_035317335.1 endosome-associated-trafficking regulator 1 isoform X3 [Cricetulus griseus]